jgi:hypothetical protein
MQFTGKNISKVNTILLFFIAIAFLFFYLFLAYHDRFASDDYEYIRIFKQYGWPGSMMNSYSSHTFRWPAILIFNIFFGVNTGFGNLHFMIFLYQFFTMALFIYAVYNLITNLSKLFLNSLPDRKHRLLFSVIFISAFYFGTIQSTDAWFWIISSCIHLQGCIFVILGSSFIIKPDKKKTDHFMIVLSFLVAGGVSENLAVLIILIFFSLSVFLFIRKRNNDALGIIFRKLMLAFIVASVSFLLNISGTGLKERIRNIREFEANAKVKVEKVQGTNQPFLYKDISKVIIRKKNIAFVLLSSLWFFFGYYIRSKKILKEAFSEKPLLTRYLKLSLPVLAISILVTLLPLYLFFHGPGPLRAWTPVSLSLTFFLSFLFLLIGCKYNNNMFLSLFRVVALVSLFIIVMYIFRQSDYVIKYASKYDERCKYLQQLNSVGNKNTIDVKGLPDSGMITNGDITEDENDPLNKDYSYVLGLNFKVRSSDNYFKCFTDSTNIVY